MGLMIQLDLERSAQVHLLRQLFNMSTKAHVESNFHLP